MIQEAYKYAGVSIKAITYGLPLPAGPLTTVCLDFINENKSDIHKKGIFSNDDDH